MKLMRYSRKEEPSALARLGVLIGQNQVADLRAGYALYLVDQQHNPKGRELAAIYMPAYLAQFLHMGEAAWLALGDAFTYLSAVAQNNTLTAGLNGEQLFIPLEECRLYAPVRPSKLIAIGRNYPGYTKNPGKQSGNVPAGFIKTSSSITGPGRDILKPGTCGELDCETELAIVIGKKCKHVSEDHAYDVIAGYTIVNDITARDIGKRERESGHPFIGKIYDTFAPMGPWMVTRDAIPEPMNLHIHTRVNGETRQDGNTRDMIWSIRKLVAYISQITLMPGAITTHGSHGRG